jgi:hypothetical protein
MLAMWGTMENTEVCSLRSAGPAFRCHAYMPFQLAVSNPFSCHGCWETHFLHLAGHVQCASWL